MSTHRWLHRSILAGVILTGCDDRSAQAAERPKAPARAAPTAAPPKANPDVNRPLTANDVWGQDYARARAQAKALHRPVLLHFHATWCGPCQQMERTVLNRNDVLKEIHSCCVAVKIDSDRHPDLIQQFGVAALPCDVFVGADGSILMANQGAIAAEQYKLLISNMARATAAGPAQVKVVRN